LLIQAEWYWGVLYFQSEVSQMKERQLILVVDDVATNILFIAEALGEEYEVSFATSAKEALESATETRICNGNCPRLNITGRYDAGC